MVAGVLFMASMDVMAKTLGQSMPVAQIVWLRLVSQAVFIGGKLISAGQRLFVTKHMKLHFLRGLAPAAAIVFFLGIIYLRLADATALIQLVPVMITMGAFFVLSKKIGRRCIIRISAAFIGTILIIGLGTSVMTTTSRFPLLGSIGFKIHTLATQFLHNDYPFRYLFLRGFLLCNFLQ